MSPQRAISTLDGKADILWQDHNGVPAIWTMNGTNPISYAALPDVGSDWHLVAEDYIALVKFGAGIASHKGEAGVSYLKSAFVSSIGVPCGVRSAAWSQASR